MFLVTIGRQCGLKLKNITHTKETARQRRLQSFPISIGEGVNGGPSAASALIIDVNPATIQIDDHSFSTSDPDRSLLGQLFHSKARQPITTDENDTKVCK